ncbi:hypothetical protein AAG570_012464 [Ranatra chinensis]|uniref:Uncharacterized protein n=1 Tax=Ranatra chinensis TaxID=642074 RepID=A0ABD0YEK7_9HEMI
MHSATEMAPLESMRVWQRRDQPVSAERECEELVERVDREKRDRVDRASDKATDRWDRGSTGDLVFGELVQKAENRSSIRRAVRGGQEDVAVQAAAAEFGNGKTPDC